MLSNEREHDRQKPVPGDSSPSDSDSTTRRRFSFGLLSARQLAGVVVSMTSWRTCEPSKVISLSLDLSFAGGDDLGTGSSDGIQTAGATARTSNQPGALSSSSSSESTLRFFDLGEGGSDQFNGKSKGATILHNPYHMEGNSRLRLNGVQQRRSIVVRMDAYF